MNISVVLPIYNEESVIEKTITTTFTKLSKFCQKVEIVAVDDGSTDRTPPLLNKLKKKCNQIIIIRHLQNKGYGAALRSGIRHASFDWIFFTDADMQFDVDELKKFIAFAKKNDFIVGYRTHRADSLKRRIISKIYNRIIRILFNLQLTDVDCAFKLMKKSAIEEINFSSNSFFVSVEVMVKAYKIKYRILEIGVEHFPRTKGVSKVTIRQIFNTVSDLVRLYKSLL